MTVPIFANGKADRRALLDPARRGRRFQRGRSTLLQTFADQAGSRIENVRLFNETKEALERQTATAEVLRVISSSPSDLEPVYRTILESITRLCESQIAVLFLFDGERLSAAASHGTTTEFADLLRRGRPKPSHETTTRLAALERRTVHVADLLSDATFSPTPRDLYERENVRTVLSVPMLRDTTLIGVMTTWRREVRPFDERQIGLIQTFADQAVIAIENVRLFNETQEALERQTATADVLQVISKSVADAQPVFEKITQSCQRLFDSSMAGINLVRPDELIDLAAYVGPNEAEYRTMYPVRLDHESGTALVIRERRAMHIPDALAGDDVPRAVRRSAELHGGRSYVIAPLIWEDRAIGAILRGQEHGFSVLGA